MSWKNKRGRFKTISFGKTINDSSSSSLFGIDNRFSSHGVWEMLPCSIKQEMRRGCNRKQGTPSHVGDSENILALRKKSLFLGRRFYFSEEELWVFEEERLDDGRRVKSDAFFSSSEYERGSWR